MNVLDPTQTEVWSDLEKLRKVLAPRPLRSLFEEDPNRFHTYSWTAAGLTFDFSKQHIDEEVFAKLLDLALAMDVEGRREAMVAGEIVNSTEQRAALHVALRNDSNRPFKVNNEDVTPVIADVRHRVGEMASAIISGTRTGFTGQRFGRVINIGIGGSDFGPKCAATALSDFSAHEIDVRFVATVDSVALGEALEDAEPEKTVFVVCSKTFTTLETKTNAEAARKWIVDALGEEAVAAHFVAATSNGEAARDFGIGDNSILPVWDWVGGRFSMWSAMGLSIALACGPDVFFRLCSGAHAMDNHFEKAPLDQNIPVIAALITIWNRNFCHYNAVAVLPYDHRLRLLPRHLQQLIMESNGKGVTLDGKAVSWETAPAVFGASGSESQHSFMQLVHQSPMVVPVEFIVSLDGQNDRNRDKLIANVFAQSEALMLGLGVDKNAKDFGESHLGHKTSLGNRPSTTILLSDLTPETFGALIAFYEHRTFVEGTLWGLNPFDQWGVELGKALATELLSAMQDNRAAAGHDSSTAGLLAAYLSQRKPPPP